ncbi:hypothetical protein MTX26_34385 [Bradyrhizobium sp. ISRA443]|uniref:hypothetical protein n=1 Tax=unclassified Bradyrhizobium TaxID=2631580 RepID=UPI00247AD326|nr:MULTISPECIES: hypothetical protein [unclassified Bradyrhizobium]WGR94475.1 hypothetical protein MTX20_09500 [Bradyrhizobium sp. ISRA435]WGR99213.1 hypothetical protein MTX23_34365 [Bradyrhizobium sp. ISRA436]WGS06104.1 hypothetical protein MTX18_34385 [Bradyrhizobium sp. ISRA437]WGS12990.1 hypothetical protein MTX26_34385 [Bradyrhizobium sp. ISRA443]
MRSPITNLGIDMSKTRLHLILCSDDIGPEAKHLGSDHRFQPSVIDGDGPTSSESADGSWGSALLALFDLGLLLSQATYLAFLEANLATLEPQGRADAEQPD